MSIKSVKNILLSLLSLMPSLLLSQGTNVNFPYFCSFEDATENANWVLNSPNQTDMCNDRWNIGGATFTEGLNSLYISTNNGFTANFGFTPNVVVAYRKITFPASNNNYTISFDWKNQAISGSGMYMCIVRESQGIPKSNPSSSVLDNMLKSSAQPLTVNIGGTTSTTTCLNNSTDWSTASWSQKITGTYYLVFMWQNSKKDTVNYTLGACVDNLQIVSSKLQPPKDLTIKTGCDTLALSWYGTSVSYQVQYRRHGTAASWRTVGVPASSGTTTKYDIIGLSEGVYDIRVKGINGTDTSAFVSRMGLPLFCEDNHCFNYVDLRGKNTTCFAGSYGSYNPVNDPIDFGITEMKSRHTVCWLDDLRDPMTEYGLKLIPDGEIASVRLGNWNINGEDERVEYKYQVDSVDPGILLLKYAVVFQDPGHPQVDQPYFQLTLLDGRGAFELDIDCGKAEFHADKKMEGWREAHPFKDKDGTVSWKDWTTLGINLDQYRGQTITIRLTTQDCLQGGHFGYAYYTLGCVSGAIESVTCGATDDQVIKAPFGFDYQWFKTYDDDGNPVENFSNEQTFKVPLSDTDPYYVRCIYSDPIMQRRGCHFDLSTIVSPRFPYSDLTLEHCPNECKNQYRLRNNSHVTLEYPGEDVVHTTERLRDVTYILSDGSEIYDENPFFVAPQEGETIRVRLISTIGDGDDACISDSLFTIIVPSILTDTVVIDTTICASAFPFVWDNYDNSQVCGEAGIYLDDQRNFAGCDSVTKLILSSTPDILPLAVDTTICFGDSVVLDDERGTRYVLRSTIKKDFILKSVFGCDSVIKLNLTVLDKVTFTVTTVDELDAPNSGEITINDAPIGYTYSLNGVMNAPLTGLHGGRYTLIVYNDHGCESDPMEVLIASNCIEIEPGFEANLVACADDETLTFPLNFLAGIPTCYSLKFDDETLFKSRRDTFSTPEVTIPIPTDCRPNRYSVDLTIEDIVCNDTTYHIFFDIYYPSSVMAQKWNNVLAVKNSGYNGGYDFTTFQWYKNGIAISGANGSYIYTSPTTMLDAVAEYYVMLTRADDGVSLPTCPIIPVVREGVDDGFPRLQTQYAPAERVMLPNVTTRAVVSIYDVVGRDYQTINLSGNDPYITMPHHTGVYMFRIEYFDNSSQLTSAQTIKVFIK